MTDKPHCCLIWDNYEGARRPFLVKNKALALEWLRRRHFDEVLRGHSMLDYEVQKAIEYGSDPDIDWTPRRIRRDKERHYFESQSSTFEVYPISVYHYLPDHAR